MTPSISCTLAITNSCSECEKKCSLNAWIIENQKRIKNIHRKSYQKKWVERTSMQHFRSNSLNAFANFLIILTCYRLNITDVTPDGFYYENE